MAVNRIANRLLTACIYSDDQTGSGTLGIGKTDAGFGVQQINDPSKTLSDISPKKSLNREYDGMILRSHFYQ
ncbi:MAG: hypothetical protein WCW40_00540 [Bacteroidota bacterium]